MPEPKSRTARVAFTDAEIRTQALAQGVRDLRDMRYPELRLRLGQCRQRGSWWVVLGSTWHRLGRWPGLTAKGAVAALPGALARLAADPRASASAQAFATFGEVLEWQLDRQQRNRALSAKRKAGIKSMINRHLLPRLRDLPLIAGDKSTLDRLLFWPLQEQYKAGYVQQAYGVLAGALRKARRLDLIAANPMDGMAFKDFITARIEPKEPALRPYDLPPLLARLEQCYRTAPGDTLLALLMLCHGTRIGETRRALRRHVLLDHRVWIIPGDKAKNRHEHILPLTSQMVALLAAHFQWQQDRGIASAYLFPGKPGAPLSEKQASEVFVRLSQGEWTSHHLRKLARTCWTEMGVDHLIGEMLLNHTIKGVAAAYIHTQAEERKREALERWHAKLDSHGFARIHGMTDARPHETRNTSEAAPVATSGDSSHPEMRRMQNAAPPADQHHPGGQP